MSLKGNNTIGIRREDKNKWERRVPLAPAHVAELVRQGVRVLVQPSDRRIFPNAAYTEAGAELSEDLSSASLILAVKEVPMDVLIPERSYVFFSHTIKAQPHNMPLLDTLLAKRIRLVDYECITEGGIRGGKRLVAFGRFAGIAGAIDYLRGLGERLLAMGFSTPFLHVGAAYTYPSVEDAKVAVRACGEAIARYGLPEAICPFTVIFTGAGNVAQGAEEIFELLPHRRVTPEDLPGIVHGRDALGDERTHQVFLCSVERDHMVQRLPEALAMSPVDGTAYPRGSPVPTLKRTIPPASRPEPPTPVDKDHYRAHPGSYEPVFHELVAPYASVIVNCMYWDARYPRLLTVKQTQALREAGHLRLLGVCDITCDFEGSIEFLREFTSIEQPFYVWDPARDVVEHSLEQPGILYHAVDHLPSELPLDASNHFGQKLMPFLPALAASDGTKPFAEQDDLPVEIKGAVICDKGKLTPNFDYIEKLREAAIRATVGRGLKTSSSSGGGLANLVKEVTATIRLSGHIFDHGVINKVLDIIESSDASANIVECAVGRDRSSKTDLQLQVFAQNQDAMDALLRRVHDTVSTLDSHVEVAYPTDEADDTAAEVGADLLGGSGGGGGGGGGAGASTGFAGLVPFAVAMGGAAAAGGGSLLRPMSFRMESSGGPLDGTDRETSGMHFGPIVHLPPSPLRRVLLLGAGMVTAPIVDYLLRRPSNHVTVAAVIPGEAEKLCRGRRRLTPTSLDVSKDLEGLDRLVASHDLVLSLVPAFLHPVVAESAIKFRKHVVTASYVSPGMQALHDRAVEAGVILLNEMGVDPGIDHMTVMRTIHDAQAAGAKVLSFSSVCGGLPAPEAAFNPLGYKFSWSPRGVLSAARQAARFRRKGAVPNIAAEAALLTAAPHRINPAFNLEVLPNRDSISYEAKYGIDTADLEDCFRGTLRYRGYAIIIFSLGALGLLSEDKSEDPFADPALFADADGHAILLRRWLAKRLGFDPAAAFDTADDDLLRTLEARVRAAAATAADLLRADEGAVRTGVAPAEGVDLLGDGAEAFAAVRELLTWLGFLAGAPASANAALRKPGPGVLMGTPLDTIVHALVSRPEMHLAEGERDMVIMQHVLRLRYPDGRVQKHLTTLIEYATGGHTAMARTVGYTAAISAQLILDGVVLRRGVATPMTRDLYAPVLHTLEGEGIRVRESSSWE